MLNENMMAGMSKDTFAPNGTLTHAMVVQILWAMEGKPVVNYAMSFADVAADSWYAGAVRWADSEGIVSGYSDTAFGSNDSVTREQLAAMLWKYAQNRNAGGNRISDSPRPFLLYRVRIGRGKKAVKGTAAEK